LLHVWTFIYPPFVVAKSCSVDELFCCRLPIHSGHGLTQCFQHHSCAFLTGGALKCWGLNDFGQVLSFELLVLGYFDVFNVNDSGQVGDNSQTSRNTPTDVVGLGSGVIRTSHGWVRFCPLFSCMIFKTPVTSELQHFSCALLNGGSMKCWGHNGYGQVTLVWCSEDFVRTHPIFSDRRRHIQQPPPRAS
jgi:hypothetical protein